MRVSTLRCLTASILFCTTLIPAAYGQASNTVATDEESKRFLANPLDTSAPVTSLAVWDGTVELIANSASYARQQAVVRPEVGPRLAAAWDKYLLTPEAKAALDTLRERARKEAEAKNEKAVERTVAEASKLINDQKFRFNAMAAYTTAFDSLDYHRGLLRPLLDRGTDADRAKTNEQLAAGESALAARMDEVLKAKQYDAAALKKVSTAVAPALRELNAQRVALAQGPQSTAIPLALISRDAACPAAVAGVEGKEKPTLGPDFPSAEEYYPPYAKSASVEGSVAVRASISETGCVTRVAVIGTSGAPEIDASALRLAMAGAYRPGLKDGKPVAGELMFRIKFELRD